MGPSMVMTYTSPLMCLMLFRRRWNLGALLFLNFLMIGHLRAGTLTIITLLALLTVITQAMTLTTSTSPLLAISARPLLWDDRYSDVLTLCSRFCLNSAPRRVFRPDELK